MASGFVCQSCGLEAPTKRLAYYQNIGALFVRFHKRVDAQLCKRCNHKFFWKFTLTNLTLGWWGYISLLVTPCFVLNNVARFLASLGMPSVPPDAKVPELTQDVLEKLNRHTGELVNRLNGGETLETVAPDFARRTGVTPGQVVRYVQYLAQLQQQQQQQRYVPPPVHGFPVLPAKPEPLPAIPLEPVEQQST